MSESRRRNDNPEKQPVDEQLEQLTAEQVEEVEATGAVVESKDDVPAGSMKIDLHCHTEASPDSSTPLSLVPGRCRERRIQVQAITDHNVISGAQRLQAMVEEGDYRDGAPLTIIVGEEVSTTEGEIIGLFLTTPVPAGLTPEETAERIKAQGGLVVLPHGFDPLKRWRLKPAALERIKELVDIVETFNARISRPKYNQAAVAWCEERGVLMCAGSDAHTLADIGAAWVEAPHRAIRAPGDLLKALEGGVPVGEWTHPWLAFAYKVWDRTQRRLFGNR
jgi:predicted metal-dependent phosphoesterase TrpH